MKSIYIDLEKKFLEDNKAEMEEEAKTADGETNHLTFSRSEATADLFNVEVVEIDDNNNTITLQGDWQGGFMSITAELSIDQLIGLIEIATKKLNKVKTVLEAAK